MIGSDHACLDNPNPLTVAGMAGLTLPQAVLGSRGAVFFGDQFVDNQKGPLQLILNQSLTQKILNPGYVEQSHGCKMLAFSFYKQIQSIEFKIFYPHLCETR